MTEQEAPAPLRREILQLLRRTDELTARIGSASPPTTAEELEHQRFKVNVLQRIVAEDHGDDPNAATTLAAAVERLRELERGQ